MDGVYDPRASAASNIAGLIRSQHSGMCSGEPKGIKYPGIPSAEDVCQQIGVNPERPLTEDEWCAACDACGCEELDNSPD